VERDLGNEKLINERFRLSGRREGQEDSIVSVGKASFGGGNISNIAGPCTIEDYDQTLEIAKAVKEAGADILRGGAFKPRTSPYSFQGLGKEGIDILYSVGKEVGIPIVSELTTLKYLDIFIEKVDMIQVGSKNMSNFELLKELGKIDKPILLKRGLYATYEEWLSSAEYILYNGNPNVILCERGIRTFETYTRNTLDILAVPVMKRLTHLPIIIDPSHSGGKWWLVEAGAKAGIAAGADGLMIEVHTDPDKAICDGSQSLIPERYKKLLEELKIR
jgi:3-deoxy-7-phosphoheptulonate synthase